jgi:chemotaxis response regulator CheB
VRNRCVAAFLGFTKLLLEAEHEEKTTAKKYHHSAANRSAGANAATQSFPIVGIGTSAGGLSAFEAFFSGMPVDTEALTWPLSSSSTWPRITKASSPSSSGRYTRMQVFEVEDGMKVAINSIYIIPPNRDMAYLNGRLHLMEPTAPRGTAPAY